MNATLPSYLIEETDEAIMDRMLAQVPDNIDKTEGSYIWDSLKPASLELAQAAIWAREILRRAFASTTFGVYLDLRCEESDVYRRQAVAATTTVLFTGDPGTVIPKGTRLATPADDQLGTPSIFFLTTQEAVIDSIGTARVPVAAEEGGAQTNVPAATITALAVPMAGITGVTNETPATGGTDTETDEDLLARYLFKIQNPATSGNKNHYILWSMEVPGVGMVSVVPTRDGPGTVAIAVLDTDKTPASQELVDRVQDYLAKPYEITIQAETMTAGGYGITVDPMLNDDTGDSMRMVYDAAGTGTLSCLIQPTKAGNWTLRPRVKADIIEGTDDLLQFGVWDATAGIWAKRWKNSTDPAVQTVKASDLAVGFTRLVQTFYFDGSQELEARITRQTADQATTVWVDDILLRSGFSSDLGDTLAPIGATVIVEPTQAIEINISATIVLRTGYDVELAKAQIEANVSEYLAKLVLVEDNDVRYVRIAQAVLDAAAVYDFSALLVNGGEVNIAIGPQEVAVLGTVTLTT